jgi:GT2 family glycosyltransferase
MQVELGIVAVGEWIHPISCPTPFHVYKNEGNKYSPCGCYQYLLEQSEADYLIYLHSDLTIHDPIWVEKLKAVCERSVACGFGGALGLGNKDLYRKPYDICNMARNHYRSNQTDAEVHGERFTGSCRVAVLDAFCMVVNVEWLRSIGGWPTKHLTHHCLDLWLACEAARHNKEIWMTGVSCTHHGGGTSTKKAYAEAKWLQGGTTKSDHGMPHKWLWDEYRDVLPIAL